MELNIPDISNIRNIPVIIILILKYASYYRKKLKQNSNEIVLFCFGIKFDDDGQPVLADGSDGVNSLVEHVRSFFSDHEYTGYLRNRKRLKPLL